MKVDLQLREAQYIQKDKPDEGPCCYTCDDCEEKKFENFCFRCRRFNIIVSGNDVCKYHSTEKLDYFWRNFKIISIIIGVMVVLSMIGDSLS